MRTVVRMKRTRILMKKDENEKMDDIVKCGEKEKDENMVKCDEKEEE